MAIFKAGHHKSGEICTSKICLVSIIYSKCCYFAIGCHIFRIANIFISVSVFDQISNIRWLQVASYYFARLWVTLYKRSPKYSNKTIKLNKMYFTMCACFSLYSVCEVKPASLYIIQIISFFNNGATAQKVSLRPLIAEVRIEILVQSK